MLNFIKLLDLKVRKLCKYYLLIMHTINIIKTETSTTIDAYRIVDTVIQTI